MITKRELRIVFMGTPGFAVTSLKMLLEHHYNIVGVITAPDKPAGRGRKLKASEVKQFALKHNLKLLQPTNLKDPSFVNELKALNSNLQIVVAFRMLPKVVWQMPKYGTFNLHASLLPNYRGAAPIHWAIINGEHKTGVTTFFIDEKIDTGAIILNQSVVISKTTTVGELHHILMNIGSELVIKTVQKIENNTVETKIQKHSKDLKTAYKLNKSNCKIDWNKPLDIIFNLIRGLNPFPTAWSYLDNGNNESMTVKLFDVEKITKEHHFKNGQILIAEDVLRVACIGGFIKVNTMQLPNKKKMQVKSLLNGFKFNNMAKMH